MRMHIEHVGDMDVLSRNNMLRIEIDANTYILEIEERPDAVLFWMIICDGRPRALYDLGMSITDVSQVKRIRHAGVENSFLAFIPEQYRAPILDIIECYNLPF